MDRHGSNWRRGGESVKAILTKFFFINCVFYIKGTSLSPSSGEGIWQSLSGCTVAGVPKPELRGGGGGTPKWLRLV